MNDRLFPARPILAVSAAVFRDGRVLIVRRARAPLIGHFSLPGGVVEVGETLAEAVARELMEEVGVSAEIIGFNRHLDAIAHEGGRVRTHFVIASFVARWTGGEARISDEVGRADWIDPAAPLPSPTTPGWAKFWLVRRGSKERSGEPRDQDRDQAPRCSRPDRPGDELIPSA